MVKVAAFVTGAAILIMELLGVRLLTPTFGGSTMVYSAVIAVFLAAMAVGYFVGGYLADRYPSRWTLAAVLAVGALLVAGANVAARPVAEAIGATRLGGLAAPVLAAFIAFSLPSAVLAFVPPIAIRLELRDVTRSGSVSGGIYAISTAGSIIGTLAVPLLIMVLRVSTSLYLLAALLLLAAGAVLIFRRTGGVSGIISIGREK